MLRQCDSGGVLAFDDPQGEQPLQQADIGLRLEQRFRASRDRRSRSAAANPRVAEARSPAPVCSRCSANEASCASSSGPQARSPRTTRFSSSVRIRSMLTRNSSNSSGICIAGSAPATYPAHSVCRGQRHTECAGYGGIYKA